jgi:hypothetical protein
MRMRSPAGSRTRLVPPIARAKRSPAEGDAGHGVPCSARERRAHLLARLRQVLVVHLAQVDLVEHEHGRDTALEWLARRRQQFAHGLQELGVQEAVVARDDDGDRTLDHRRQRRNCDIHVSSPHARRVRNLQAGRIAHAEHLRERREIRPELHDGRHAGHAVGRD